MAKLLEAHLAFLPCLLEITDGKTASDSDDSPVTLFLSIRGSKVPRRT